MKVTVQNGVQHGLSRQDVEALLPEFPAHWRSLVKSILLCANWESDIASSFHKKEGVLAISWPLNEVHSATREKAVECLVLSLATVGERGELPARLSPSIRQALLEQVNELLGRCYEKLSRNTA